MLLAPYVRFHTLSLVWVTEYPLIGIIAAHSAYNVFYKYKYLIVNCFFPPRFLEWEFLSDCAIS